MGSSRFSERRTRCGDALARAMLDAPEPLSFDELMDAAPECSTRAVSAWLGHAMADGLIAERGSEFGSGLRFALKARGRRILSARRRAAERNPRNTRAHA